MSIASALGQIRNKVENAFDEYCDELADREKGEADEFTGKLEQSIEVYEKRNSSHTLEAKVGVNVPKLISIQLNVNKVNYAKFYAEGHKRVTVPFEKKVPNSKKSGNGYYWHIFRSTNGNPFIKEAFESMPSFKSFYK